MILNARLRVKFRSIGISAKQSQVIALSIGEYLKKYKSPHFQLEGIGSFKFQSKSYFYTLEPTKNLLEFLAGEADFKPPIDFALIEYLTRHGYGVLSKNLASIFQEQFASSLKEEGRLVFYKVFTLRISKPAGYIYMQSGI